MATVHVDCFWSVWAVESGMTWKTDAAALSVTDEEDAAWLAYIADKRRFSEHSEHMGRLTPDYRRFIDGFRAARGEA